MKHKHEDLKLACVRHYLDTGKSYADICRTFNVKERTLKRWIERYEEENEIKRHNRPPVSYKIRRPHIQFAITELRRNEQITMFDLDKKIRERFSDYDITPQHLGEVIRDHNKTRKRTRIEHFPATRYGQPVDRQAEFDRFYDKIDEYALNKIICMDETSVQLGLSPDYSRCNLGKRCVLKTDNNAIFKKYTLLSAISSTGLVGYVLYDEGGMNTERMVAFLTQHIVGRFRNHLVVMDNAGAHKKPEIRATITNSGNELLYTIPYTPKTNAIENWFSQLKHYLKKDGVLTLSALRTSVRTAIGKIRPENYLNYFRFAYRKEELRQYEHKLSTLHHKPKTYKA
jgi:putative transposase